MYTDRQIKGADYETQIKNYLMETHKDYEIYLWKDIPIKYLIQLGFIKEMSMESIKEYNDPHTLRDMGCDIFMVNGKKIIYVQCKNYTDKKICVKDLSG